MFGLGVRSLSNLLMVEHFVVFFLLFGWVFKFLDVRLVINCLFSVLMLEVRSVSVV